MHIGDFNVRKPEWWNDDSANLQGTEITELSAQYSLNQVIDGPTHILPNSASCFDLILITERDFVTDLGVLPSRFSRCHHRVSFTTFFLLPLSGESGVFQGLMSMLSGSC